MWEKIVIVGSVFLFVIGYTPLASAHLQMADSIEIPDVIGVAGDNILVPVNLTNTSNGPVQTILFNVEYNDSVIELIDIKPGNLTPISNGWQHILGENKKSVTVATAQSGNAIPNGSTGSLVLLNYSIIGEPSDVSPLNISDLDISNINFQHGIAPIKNGTFIINSPPDIPSKPSGPSSGYTGSSYSYSTSTTDPDNNQIKYGWDWNGDDIVDEWTGLYNSESTCRRSHSWSSQGTYYIRVKAQDAHGNESDWSPSTSVSITVYSPPPSNHPPAVLISKFDGAVVSGIVTINGTASNPDGNEELVKVEIKINDGTWITATGKTSWSYEWDTTLVENGNYTISARSYDGEDYSTIKSVTVEVLNNHPPIVNITSPINASEVNGTITITGNASDQDGNETVQKVEIKIDDGGWAVVIGTTSWNYTWDTTSVKNGNHTIYVRAWDGTDYSSIDSIEIEVKNKKEEEGIPAFEFAFLIIAIASIILLKRRNKRNQ